MSVPINYWAVLVAAAINMLVGTAWYSSALFSKPWSKLVGRKDMSGGPGYAVAIVVALLQNYILAHFVYYAGATTVAAGLGVSMLLWIGFVAATSGLNTAFAGRPWKLWAIDAGYFLVVMLVNGAIFATWH